MTDRHLGILGGKPAFAAPRHVGQPNVGDLDGFMGLLRGIFDRSWFTNNGPLVEQLESALSEHLGVPHVVAMCNGTVALEIAIRALGLTGEVIVPSYTFVASAHALKWHGIDPVFVDVDPVTHTLDVNRVSAAVTPRTSAILAVHLWGGAANVAGLSDLARRHDLRLLFDAAHSFSSQYGTQRIGSFGDAEVFSFHATKFFNSFEGGAVTTADDDLARRLRLMRNFGFDGVDRVVALGTNGKMTEVCAAMALANLAEIDEFLEINARNLSRYRRCLDLLPGLRVFDPDQRGQSNRQYVVCEVDPTVASLSRDAIVSALWAENVIARRYFTPGVHRMEPYATLSPGMGKTLPVTEQLADNVMVLPTGAAVSETDIDTICHLVETALAQAEEIKKSLAQAA